MELVVLSQSTTEAHIRCYAKHCATDDEEYSVLRISKWEVSSRCGSQTSRKTTRPKGKIIHHDIKLYELTKGWVYTVQVKCHANRLIKTGKKDRRGQPIVEHQFEELEATVKFTSVQPYCTEELKTLRNKANNYIMSLNKIKYKAVKCFIRTKMDEYYDDIMAPESDGVMNVYIKDFNGDPRSPINHRLTGLFFEPCTQLAKARFPSPYGNKCLSVKPDALLKNDTRLYFADFYCMTTRCHTVTLVATERMSPADIWCREFLVPLKMNKNYFLRIGEDGIVQAVTASAGLTIEVLYCNDVNVRNLIFRGQAVLESRPMRGKHRHNGRMKKASCALCNICSEDIDYSPRQLIDDEDTMESLVEQLRMDVRLTDNE
jgi:hypothetical protein